MNADTGRIYELEEALAPATVGEFLSPKPFDQKLAAGSPLTRDEQAARVGLERGEKIVRVSGAVAQTMKVGQRELARRRRRRRKTGSVAGS